MKATTKPKKKVAVKKPVKKIVKPKYTWKKFLSDVTKEVELIKVHATKEEKNELNLDYFNPSSPSNCVYGQMAGDCCSSRAHKLIFKCCQKYLVNHKPNDEYEFNPEFVLKNMNGTKPKGVKKHADLSSKRNLFSMQYLSALEAYIILPKAKNKNIINYIKGKKRVLILE